MGAGTSAGLAAIQHEYLKRTLLTEQKQRGNKTCIKCGKAIADEEFAANEGFCAKCLAIIQQQESLQQPQEPKK